MKTILLLLFTTNLFASNNVCLKIKTQWEDRDNPKYEIQAGKCKNDGTISSLSYRTLITNNNLLHSLAKEHQEKKSSCRKIRINEHNSKGDFDFITYHKCNSDIPLVFINGNLTISNLDSCEIIEAQFPISYVIGSYWYKC